MNEKNTLFFGLLSFVAVYNNGSCAALYWTNEGKIRRTLWPKTTTHTHSSTTNIFFYYL
jgi:hypothetical protein